ATFDWLLSCQHRQPHPFTGAAPGGWGWTDKSGAVPDADDTPGALLALAAMRDSADQRQKATLDTAAIAGIGWLLDLQNRDGGWPTFCRGWGKLPFDRSGVDLTAHALRAFFVWKNIAQTPLVKRTVRRLDSATRRGLAFLAKHQRPDGSWVPLWFGNQDHPLEENPVYGTARVLLAYRDLGLCDSQPARSGLRWLVDHRNPDGGWGGKNPDAPGASAAQVSSVEETAVATEALISTGNDPLARAAAESGVAWLIGGVEAEMYQESSPIGFYFAKLWYYERLYPLIFTVAALGHAVDRSRWEPSARTTPTSVGKPENTA
ncbi:MAG: squalene--hopene cyclase, partial [Planctomycetes bacterium]|nr:squalene--hopene cyclase [Planctomycetota bacterium]